MMQSTMQDFPLNVGMIFRHGRPLHGDSEVVTFEGDGEPAGIVRRGRRTASSGSRRRCAAPRRSSPATASARSCGTPRSTSRRTSPSRCMGAVLHTLNIRLFPEQLAYIVNHAEDRVVIVDDIARARCWRKRRAPSSRRSSTTSSSATATPRALEERRAIAEVLRYDERARRRANPAFDVARGRRTGRGGDVLHERHHRQPEGRRLLAPLHVPALASAIQAGSRIGLTERDRVLPIVPMFHANAWGMPYAAWMAGADFVMPEPLPPGRAARAVHRARRSPPSRARCPTIWTDLLRYADANPRRPLVAEAGRVRRLGGAACAHRARSRSSFGVRIVQGWGMTETSPLAAVSLPAEGRRARHHRGDGLARAQPGAHHRRRRAAHRRRRRHVAAVGRRGGRRDRGARAVDHRLVLPRSRAREVRRRLAAHRRRRQRHAERATSRSPTGRRTSSSRAASGSRRSSSRVMLMAHPRRRRGGGDRRCPTRGGTSGRSRASCARGRRPTTAAELREFLGDHVAKWQLPERWTFIDEVPEDQRRQVRQEGAARAVRRRRARRGGALTRRPARPSTVDDHDPRRLASSNGSATTCGCSCPRSRSRCSPARSSGAVLGVRRSFAATLHVGHHRLGRRRGGVALDRGRAHPTTEGLRPQPLPLLAARRHGGGGVDRVPRPAGDRHARADRAAVGPAPGAVAAPPRAAGAAATRRSPASRCATVSARRSDSGARTTSKTRRGAPAGAAPPARARGVRRHVREAGPGASAPAPT